jgi:hypothetical protein
MASDKINGAVVYESEGRRFESCWAHQTFRAVSQPRFP